MYKKEIEELQCKLLTTMAECDTIRSAFQALIGVVKLPEDTDPLLFLLTSINIGTQANMSKRVQLSKDTYPGLRFRMWMKISMSAKSLIYQIMIKEHPLLGLDEDSFKLEMLCVNDYSGWHKNHLTPNGEWKEPSHKTEPKEEPKLEYTDIVSLLAMKGKKHQSDPKLTPLGPWIVVEKRQEIHNHTTSDPPNMDCENYPMFDDVPLPPSLHRSPKNVPCGVVLPMPAGQSHSGSLTQAESAALAGLSSLSHHNSNKENTFPPLMNVFGMKGVAKAPQLSTLSRHNSNKENEFSLQDPLANVFSMNGIAKKPPPPAPTYPSMPAASQEPLEPSTAKMKKSKMCPGICVHIDG
ncbi:hypothetical protein EDC04DRAFT_2607532 [Pisolithus marmoratus]|nr:hypothetical protein EDC04DRAFT_2607532 [Pisolithus marmoratus]